MLGPTHRSRNNMTIIYIDGVCDTVEEMARWVEHVAKMDVDDIDDDIDTEWVDHVSGESV